MTANQSAAAILRELRAQRNPKNIEGMKRFAIASRHEILGIGMTDLRRLARLYWHNHSLALALWESGVFEAMMLATMVDEPAAITRSQMARWVRACDNWALTDAVAFLFDRTPFAEATAHAWSARTPEFVKRTGFAIMAGMAIHRKELPDAIFLRFLPVIRREAADERNFVRKAVNWALRQIGKRNPRLRRAAIAEARRIVRIDSRAARWIARDALRELGRGRRNE